MNKFFALFFTLAFQFTFSDLKNFFFTLFRFLNHLLLPLLFALMCVLILYLHNETTTVLTILKHVLDEVQSLIDVNPAVTADNFSANMQKLLSERSTINEEKRTLVITLYFALIEIFNFNKINNIKIKINNYILSSIDKFTLWFNSADLLSLFILFFISLFLLNLIRILVLNKLSKLSSVSNKKPLTQGKNTDEKAIVLSKNIDDKI